MKKTLLLLLILVVSFSQLFSQSLYSSTSNAGYNANPGFGIYGTPVIVLDDVQVPSSLVAGSDSFNVTKVKFGIVREASAPAITVKMYYTTINKTATGYEDLIAIPPVLIGSLNLPANGETPIFSILSVGDSINTLFKVKTDTGYFYTGAETFFLGMSFSDSSGLNGWVLTTPGAPQSNNDNAAWDYDAEDSAEPTGAFNFGTGSPSATFYLEAFGGPASPLPVSLASFDARRSGKVNLLSWSTSQELNSRNFVIERSTDGLKYLPIGQVAAAGNSSIIRNYTFTDAQPAKGYNYYRLRTVDIDNAFKLSAIRTVRNAGIADVHIYPNPVVSQLTVSVDADKASEGQMVITDMSGKAVYEKTVSIAEGNTVLTVLVNNIAAGQYVLKILLDNDVIVKKFNKQ